MLFLKPAPSEGVIPKPQTAGLPVMCFSRAVAFGHLSPPGGVKQYCHAVTQPSCSTGPVSPVQSGGSDLLSGT